MEAGVITEGVNDRTDAGGDGDPDDTTDPSELMIRSFPFFHRIPHALHNDFGPFGPDRHRGV